MSRVTLRLDDASLASLALLAKAHGGSSSAAVRAALVVAERERDGFADLVFAAVVRLGRAQTYDEQLAAATTLSTLLHSTPAALGIARALNMLGRGEEIKP